MHVQIVNFNLKGLSDEEFRAAADELAPAFAEVPGLLTKVWLADPASNTYGGVYLWLDEDAMRAYAASELFGAVVSNPHFANLTSRSFDTLTGPTKVTGGRIFQESA